MKHGLLPLLAALLVSLAGARADSGITFQDFYDALTPDGDWVEIDDYGYCWRPFVDDHWRPYTDGQWVYTDAGYTWFSNEPWGWATYHYGRWTKVKSWGWVWVPGYEWGPAWVSWRTGDDYIGWAALPPEAVWEPSTGFGAYVDVDYGIGPDWYSFCPVVYFGAPRLRTVCLPWRNNITIINLTVNITRIRNVNNVIINDGPDITLINRRAETPIRRVRLEREANPDVAELRLGKLKSRIEGDTLKLPSPRVEKQEARPTKIAGRASRGQINRGWEMVEKNPAQAAEFLAKTREEARRSGRPLNAEIPPQVQEQPPQTQRNVTRQDRPPERNDIRPPDPTPAVQDPERQPQVLPRNPLPVRQQQDRRPQVLPLAQTPAGPQQEREEELRSRILQQRQQQQDREARQTELSRQQELAQQQQQSLRQQQQQQQAEESSRKQRAAEIREKAARAQEEAAARQQQQLETVRQQQEQQQRQQQSLQQQLQQQREQLQQHRQERRQSP